MDPVALAVAPRVQSRYRDQLPQESRILSFYRRAPRECTPGGPHRWMVELPNFFRVPFGPGRALVGDAGHHKDPLVARGISDAFRDAEFLAEAAHRALAGEAEMAMALQEYHRCGSGCKRS